ncbi:hypothetical protein, partial [Burkholderia cenocepacia]|uniref:hypothetical protein n=1 Tax=Burkholderia cenocepacia TaxID=95486 RepID=UPI0028568C66
ACLRGILNPSAALRFQQQRSEIMNRVSQLVNNFLNDFVATAGPNFRTAKARYLRTPTALLPFPPRRVSVSAKEA